MAAAEALQRALTEMASAIATLAAQRAPAPAGSGDRGIPHFPRYVEDDNIEDFCVQFEGLTTVHNYDAEKTKASFLALLPANTFQLLKNLIFPETFATRTYEQLKTTLVEHLRPAPLRIPARHALCSRKQKEGESISDYMAALRALAVHCGYEAATLGEILKDIFVAGVRSKSILDQLFTEPDTADLDVLFKKAVAIERAQSSTLQVLSEAPLTVNKVVGSRKTQEKQFKATTVSKSSPQVKKESNQVPVCYCCGKKGHKAPECRNKDQLHCKYCDRDGHVESVCKQKKYGSRVHHIDSSEHYDVSSMPWVSTVRINNTPVQFELDTGCDYTILPLSLYNTIRPTPELHKTTKVFKPYGATTGTMQALGTATVTVTNHNKRLQLPLYVIKEQDTPLMGRQWLKPLGIYNPPPVIHTVKEVSAEIDQLKSEFSSVFAEGIGLAPITVALSFKNGAQPVFRKHRTVPYALRGKVEEELNQLVAAGVLEPVDHSEWATPIVPVIHKNGSVRITADYSCTVNPNLLIPTYPLPRFDELISKVAHGKVYCKLDIRKAYLCLPMDEPASKALTITTHKGLFRPTRLMFGCAAAPVIWTKFIEEVTKNIDGLAVFFDDLLIAAEDVETLKLRLREVLQRLQDHGLRLNRDKCSFFVKKVLYLGHELSASGIRPASESLEAIRNLPTPKGPADLKKFLGMVSFYAKFFKGMAEMAAPLYDATKKNTRFNWTRQCSSAFRQLKGELTSDRVLVPYDPKLPVTLSADAGPRGIGAVLAHTYSDGSERPIVYIHKKLDKCQVNYSQIDKEALAIKWAVEKLHPYLIGRTFTLITDHQPLVHIFGARRKKLPPLCATRLLHYALFLQDFTFNIQYRASELHGNADFLSRLPSHSAELPQCDSNLEDQVDTIELHHLSILPMSIKSIRQATLRDPEGRELLQKLRLGETLGDRDGLYSLQAGCVMRGLRTFIPPPLRKAVLAELHEGHLGIVKMKALARSYVYWNKLDADIEELCRNCRACSLHKGHPPTVDTHYWEYPKKPWERIHADFAMYGKNTYLIIVDAHSKWPEISIVPNMYARTVIAKFSELFARFGLPSCLVTDNQSTFVSREVREYLHARNVKHLTIAPYHAATNGLAERMVGSLKSCLRTLQYSSGKAEDHLLTFLAAYRRAPHTTTGVSPAMAFLKRELQSPLSFCQPTESSVVTNRAQRTFKDPAFKEGDKVAVRDFVNPLHKWKLGTIIARDGQLQYTVLIDGALHRRHIEHLRRVGSGLAIPPAVPPLQVQTVPVPLQEEHQQKVSPPPTARLSGRRSLGEYLPGTPRQSLQTLTEEPETPRTHHPTNVSVEPPVAPVPKFTPPAPGTPPLAQRREPRVRRPVDRYTPSH